MVGWDASSEAGLVLAGAVEVLYRRFGKGLKEDRVDRWLDMVLPEFEQRARDEVRSRGVRDLSDEVYAHTAWHAMCWDAGHDATVKYFLPRLFEESVDDRGQVEAAMLANVLSRLLWRRWKAGEAEAIEMAWRAAWRARIVKRRHGDAWAGIMLFVGFEVGELQDELSRWPLEVAAIAVAEIVEDWQSQDLSRPLARWAEIWGDRGVPLDRREEVARWMCSDDTRKLLEAGFWACDRNAAWAERISLAEHFLASIRSAR